MTNDISTPQAEEPFLKNKVHSLNLLNRPPPENYGTEQLASLNTQTHEDFPTGRSLLVFRIANEWLALPNYCIKEITPPSFIHKLPHTTTNILLGISNVHGDLLITISMQAFLNIHNASTQSNNTQSVCKFARNIVLEINKNILVFSVDEIYGLTQIELSLLEPPAITITKSIQNYCTGIFSLNNTVVGLLDESRIITTLNETYL